jgi:hypothetical protein
VAFKVRLSLFDCQLWWPTLFLFSFSLPHSNPEKEKAKTKEKEKGRDEDTRNNRLKPKINKIK